MVQVQLKHMHFRPELNVYAAYDARGQDWKNVKIFTGGELARTDDRYRSWPRRWARAHGGLPRCRCHV